MKARFKPLEGAESLESALDQSTRETVILFNHDPWCPVSARAYRQMEQVERDVLLIDVARERSLTREIQSRTGVPHESPQVIVLRDGASIWSASHFEIRADAVRDATTSESPD